MLDFAIIGCGITGAVFARLLQLSGIDNFLILEHEHEPGGLCRTRSIGPHVLDVGGGHFLCSRFPEVYEFIFAHIRETEFNRFDRVSKLRVGGHVIDYPLESNLWQLPPAECAAFLISIARNGEARGLPPPKSFRDWIVWNLGDAIADAYMVPYNTKLWGVPPSDMDIDWLHKIPRISVQDIFTACLSRRADPDQMPSHASFYYPKTGGFQRIFDAVFSHVSSRLESGTRVELIESIPGGVRLNGRIDARKVVNTAPWTAFADSPVFDAEARRALKTLRAADLVVSLHHETYGHDHHWLYEPDPAVDHHRSFYIRNFAPHSAPGGVFRETNGARWKADSNSTFHHHNRFAYPVPVSGWARTVDLILRQAAAAGVYGLGRWGQWRHFNSDVCIREAMSLCEALGHTCWRDASRTGGPECSGKPSAS